MNRKVFLKKIGLLGSVFLFPYKNTEAKPVNEITNPPKPLIAEWKNEDINISLIGHSTVLINFFGKIILTDPVLFKSIGLEFLGIVIGPARYSDPALSIDEIPKPDLLLLSHTHLDHADYPTLRYIANKYPAQIDCLTAYNTMDVIQDLPWKSLAEIDWGESTIINDINIKALKVRHFGWRFPWERDRSRGYFSNGRSFNAYIMERGSKKILFGGDTAMTDEFKKSGESVDIAIMPIGAYNPWKMNHCSP